MDLFVDCPNCGKTLTYGPKNAGAVWLCTACGSRVQLPGDVPTPPPPLPVPVEAEVLDEPILVESGSRLLPWLIVLGVVVFVQCIAMFWYFLRSQPPKWDQLHRQEVFDLKSEAELLESRNQLQPAYERFEALSRLVEGNPITDPAVKSAVDIAAREQSELLDRLLHPPVAAVPTAPATQPLAAATAKVIATPPTPPIPRPPPPAPVVYVRPKVHPLPPPAPAMAANGKPLVDDEQIGRTIDLGVEFLIQQFQADFEQNRVRNSFAMYGDGTDALCVYALLQAYQATGDSRLDPKRPFMKTALDTLKRLPLAGHYGTYARSLRANALALAGRKEDHAALEADLHWLLEECSAGAYTYPNEFRDRANRPPADFWDNSNSQYGLLGVWAAAEAGLPVPRSYWQAAQQHWTSSQLADATWGYRFGDTFGRRSMTLAGIASLFVTQDYLLQTDSSAGRSAAQAKLAASELTIPELDKALAWLETGDNSVVSFNDAQTPGYSVYGLERVGLASGFKFFGTHDWYRESAADIVSLARPDGSWGNEIDTSFALLVLARGRHPVVMNKLRFDGAWNNHPRDVANLTRYATRMLERQLNWQVVPLSHDWTDWTDSSILYLTGHDAPNISPDDEQKLRLFVQNGGLLLTDSDAGGDGFIQWATDLGTRLFPTYQWADVPADHPLWTVELHLKNPPLLKAISNGSRLLMVQLPPDIARIWQSLNSPTPTNSRPTAPEAAHPDEFGLGLDLFLYASGRSDLRNRLVSLAIPPVTDETIDKLNLLELAVSPDNDPEPAAWPRFANWFTRQTDVALNLTPILLENLPAQPNAKEFAHFTGVQAINATNAQCAALARYVTAGGVVLIDPCGGPNEFLKSVRSDLLSRAFPNSELERIDSTHPLLTNSADGMSQLAPLEIRDYTRRLDPPADRGIYILRSGKGAVVVSSLDITSGLLGTNTWGIAGLAPASSMALAKNFLIWAWDGAKD